MNTLFRRLRTLITPNLPEPIEIATWRRYERLGLWVPPFLAALNALGLWTIDGVNKPAYRMFLLCNVPAHALLMIINGMALWRAKTDRGHRAAAYASVVLLHYTAAVALWIQSDGGRLLDLILMIMAIVFYRLATDGRIGFVAFVVAFADISAFVALNHFGILRAEPLMVNGPPPTGLLITFWFWSSALLFLSWVITSYVANRFRAASYALSMERAQARKTLDAAMAEAGHGKLTGSVLKDAYRILELLGRGGMGEVYEAQRLDDGVHVAIKVLFPHLAEQTQMLERFRREALAARRLPVTCAPEVLDVGETADGTHYIVMERLRGEDLAALLRRRGRLEPDEVRRLVDRIALALDAAHAQSIVHRDLKPQNVFLIESANPSDWPEVRLLDFGIARLRDGVGNDTITAEAVVLGSPGFLAPEQARGDSSAIGPRTDIFALGAIVYRALTGINAFPSRNAANAIYEAIHHTPSEPSRVCPGLPQALDTVLGLAMAKDPARRYASAGELARAFADACAGYSGDATAPTLTNS